MKRANGFQLIFEFYKNLDLKIKYEYGQFKNSDCRLRDFIYKYQLSENKIPSLIFKFANSYYKKIKYISINKMHAYFVLII
jgi:hypothetical protein